MEEDFLVEASEIQIEKEALKSQIRKLECITTSFNKKSAETMCKSDEEKAAYEKSLKQKSSSGKRTWDWEEAKNQSREKS